MIHAVAAAAPANARITVDAGAHMLSAMALWPAQVPFDVLISNGLSTMGFAVPAAIAAALEAPERPVIAFTGDGGLAMCLGELATAARERLPVIVVVFNDGALSMIDLKQQQRSFATAGVRFAGFDFTAVARGMGCAAWRVDDPIGLERAVAKAAALGGAAVIDAAVDSAPYRKQFEALRGAPGVAANA